MDTDNRKIKLIDHHLVWQADDCLQIRSEGKSIVLRGNVARTAVLKVLALLDGTLSRSEVRMRIAALDNPEQCGKVMQALVQRDMIEAIDPVPDELKVYDPEKLKSLSKHFKLTAGKAWEPLLTMRRSTILLVGAAELVIPTALNLAACAAGRIVVLSDPIAPRDIGRSRHVSAADIGRHPADLINAQLGGKLPVTATAVSGNPATVLEWRQLLKDCTLVITACSRPVLFNDQYDALNKAALEEGVCWLPLAVLDNREVQVGPSLIPHETACFKCYEYRFRSNFRQIESYQAFADSINALRDIEDHGVLAPFAELAANYAAIEAIRLLTPDLTAISAGKVLSINLEDLATQKHPVLRVPRCPHCNQHAERCPERVWA